LFTGVKTKYQTVGLDSSASENSDLNDRLGSIIDWAQAANKRTGIVTTTRFYFYFFNF
jgi:alkaline phosphatase